MGLPQAQTPSLAEALRQRRRQRRWRQADLARALQVTQQTVARWESGDVPQRRLFGPLAEFLEVDLEQFYELLEAGPPRSNLIPIRDDGTANAEPMPLTTAQRDVLNALLKRIEAGVPIGGEEMQFFRRLGAAVGLEV